MLLILCGSLAIVQCVVVYMLIIATLALSEEGNIHVACSIILVNFNTKTVSVLHC